MPYPVAACRAHGGMAPVATVLSRAVFWTKAKGSAGVLVDGSGNGHAIQHGSTSGADSNDPLWLPHGGTQFAYFPGSAGDFASSPDSAALSPTGDLGLYALLALDAWAPGVQCTPISKRPTGAGAGAYQLDVQTTTGLVGLSWWDSGGTLRAVTSSVAPTVADGTLLGVGATLDVDNGSGGHTVTFYTSPDGTTWTQLGTTRSAGAFTTSVKDSADDLWIGDDHNSRSLAGKVYRVQVYGDLARSDLRFDADFSDVARLTEPFATFTEKSSNGATVTLNRATSGRKLVIVDRDLYLLGTDDYFEIADAADLNFALTDSFTVAVLVRQQATPASTGSYCSKQGSTGPGYNLITNATAIQSRGVFKDGTHSVGANAPVFSAGALTLVALQRDTALGKIRAYADGFGTDVTDTTTATLANSLAARIGRGAGTVTNYQDFVFLGAAVFREVLSAADLARIKSELLA